MSADAPPAEPTIEMNMEPANTLTFEANDEPTNTLAVSNATPEMQLLCSVCATQEVLPPGPKRKKPKTCKVVVDGVTCPYPTTCPGRVHNDNCFLYTGGDPSKKLRER